MPTFKVTYRGAAFTTVTVEAEDAEDAIDAGYDKLPDELCIHCADDSASFTGTSTVTREWPDSMEFDEITHEDGSPIK